MRKEPVPMSLRNNDLVEVWSPFEKTFTRVTIVLESGNNSYACKLHLKKWNLPDAMRSPIKFVSRVTGKVCVGVCVCVCVFPPFPGPSSVFYYALRN